jgi:mono/diheme cytochrome c family protein
MRTSLTLAALLLLAGCNFSNDGNPNTTPPPGCLTAAKCASTSEALNPPDQLMGERLFKDTRFGHYFAVNSHGDVNSALPVGESVVDKVVSSGDPSTLPGPMRGQAVNCLQCHLVQQELDVKGGGMRTYADFAQRSPMPVRAEDIIHTTGTTPRNAADMVDDVFHGDIPDRVLHWDAQFGSMSDLVDSTLTGRNYGWLPEEYTQAVHQVAEVIHKDDGANELARTFSDSLPYATLFACADPHIPAAYRLPQQYCLDIGSATDEQIESDVSALIAAYVDSLTFSQDDAGNYNGSPYDQFLIANGLPPAPAAGQDTHAYAANLLKAIQALPDPTFVNQGQFQFHDQRSFSFGPQELRGLVTFLRTSQTPLSGAKVAQGGIGDCAACHTPPAFNDFMVHNTGVSQAEYDQVHGQGSFAVLSVPDLSQRNADPDAYLPVSPQHPDASERFRMAAVADDPDKADLGVWNIFANPDFPLRKAPLRKFLCAINSHRFADCGASDDQLLSASLGVFKTRTVRDLGDSDPYMHDGQFQTLEDALKFYQNSGNLARAGKLRNGDPAMQDVALSDQDVKDIAAFLAALDEDYSN